MPKSTYKGCRVIGIDLAGTENRETGWALLYGCKVEILTFHSDDEILRKTLESNPLLVAIDAPLTLPKDGKMRLADREMKKLGYSVLPPLFPGMKDLTLRGIRLASKMRENGIRVIEVHPTSSRKALGLPVIKDVKQIRLALLKLGLRGDIEKDKVTIHELDAVIAALTAKLHLDGKTIKVGSEREGYIIIPRPVIMKGGVKWKKRKKK